MAVAGEDRADHGGVALAPRVGAQLVDARRCAARSRPRRALVGEGRQDQPVDALGLRLREGAARIAPDDVPYMCIFCRPVSFMHHRHRGLQILDAAGDVGVVAGAAGVAVAVVVHGPDVIAVARHDVHQRIFALARHARGRRTSASSSTSRAPGTGSAAASRRASARRRACARD